MEGDLLLHTRDRDIGGFTVHRALPSIQKKQVGPFVFLDHMGPVRIDAQHALDVRPHPHIGLATVTYLFSGRGYHRDSLGSKQLITPGDINWMTAGRGIVHSERSPEEDRIPDGPTMEGVQIWVALPRDQEECEPSFIHWPKSTLPEFSDQGLQCKLLLGSYGSSSSPVECPPSTLFMDLQCPQDIRAKLSFMVKELALFCVAGQMQINGQGLKEHDMLIIKNPADMSLAGQAGSRCVLIGGDPYPESRYIWWNFVSSRKERIHQAAKDWEKQIMGKIPGETEFIPLPTDRLP